MNRWQKSQKSGDQAAQLVCSGGNLASAEVEKRWNIMFANDYIPSQKSEAAQVVRKLCGNLDETDAGRKIIARLLPPQHHRYKTACTDGSRYTFTSIQSFR